MKFPAHTVAGWSGRLLIEAVFLSLALVAWLSLPGHEKVSHALTTLHRLRATSSFHFPVLHACGLGFMIAALSAALTPVVLGLAGLAPYQNGPGFLVTGWAMWYAARFLHGSHH